MIKYVFFLYKICLNEMIIMNSLCTIIIHLVSFVSVIAFLRQNVHMSIHNKFKSNSGQLYLITVC